MVLLLALVVLAFAEGSAVAGYAACTAAFVVCEEVGVERTDYTSETLFIRVRPRFVYRDPFCCHVACSRRLLLELTLVGIVSLLPARGTGDFAEISPGFRALFVRHCPLRLFLSFILCCLGSISLAYVSRKIFLIVARLTDGMVRILHSVGVHRSDRWFIGAGDF